MRSPLFDIYDPYGELDMQAQMGMLPPDEEDVDEYGIPRQRKRATLSDLLPEEEKRSMLGRIANMGASGLTGLGYLLDTPGALVRGVLAGKPLSVFGGADERVTGRDLFRQMGLAGDEDNWMNWSAGLAGEIVLDPLTYLNPLAVLGRGAASAAGRAAQRSGLLENVKLMARRENMGVREFMRRNTPEDLFANALAPDNARQLFEHAATAKGLDPADLVGENLAGLMEARLPFSQHGYMFSGGSAGDTLARSLDQFGEALTRNPYTGPIANRLTKAFDVTAMEQLHPDDQWRGREAWAKFQGRSRDMRERHARAYLSARRAGDAFDEQSIQNAIVDSIEAAGSPERIANLSPQSRRAIEVMESVPEWRQYRDFARQELEDQMQTLAELGVQVPAAPGEGQMGYFSRQKVLFDNERIPERLGKDGRPVRPYERGERVFTTDDVFGASRRGYLKDLSRDDLRRLMQGEEGRALRDRLTFAEPDSIPGVLDEAFQTLGMRDPYENIAGADGVTLSRLRQLVDAPPLSEAERAADLKAMAALEQQAASYKQELGDLLGYVDRNFADTGRGLYDRHTMADLLRSGTGSARSAANAEVLVDSLVRMASELPPGQIPGGGGVEMLKAAEGLGFNPSRLKEILESRLPGRDIAQMSISEADLRRLRAVSPRPQSDPTSMLDRLYRSFTNAFKIGALATPSYHTRNIYSGGISTLSAGEMGPVDMARSFLAGGQAGRGNYDALFERLKDAPALRHLKHDKQALIDEVLVQSARNPLGQGLLSEFEGGLRNPADNLIMGMDPQDPLRLFGDGGVLYDPNRSWTDWATVKGVDFAGAASGRRTPSETLNPLLRLHERAGRRGEDFLRIGTFIEALRQGFSPDAASDLVFKTQVNYAPEAFTQFERQIKRAVPFYSYTRGIAPLVGENLLYRPGGLQGQVTRAISDLARPSDDQFVPEHLRATASIPLPFRLGEEGNLQRFLTNVDVPWEGLVNLVSPGTGNNVVERVTSGIQKTGLNLMGQLNPLIKAPLELLMDRQLYSGRQMSDLYSMLEQDIGPLGRPLEQLLANAPGGSRAISIARTARDSRMSPQERALKLLVNNFAGVKLTDVDEERSKSLAARNMLNELLRTTGGVRSYENITVPDEVLAGLPKEKQDMYLLYRVLQSDAAKRARARKQAEQDPMEVLLGGLR